MGRKNINACHKQRKLRIPRNHHFIYSVNEDGSNASVVRFLGEQESDYLWCFHPDGFAMWIHLSHLSNVPRRAA